MKMSHDNKVERLSQLYSIVYTHCVSLFLLVSRQSIPIVFRWDSGGHEAYICGSFNNWETKIPMTNRYNNIFQGRLIYSRPVGINSFSLYSSGDFTAIVDLHAGRHEYKFFVDGQWLHDPNEVYTS